MKKEEIKIGDTLWHPCSIDIIEHRVISVRQFEGFNHYVSKAVNNVGVCGKIEVITDEHKGRLRFVELLHKDELEYVSGLQDFVEGNYYTNKEEAELDFYESQKSIAYSNMEEKRRLLEDSIKRYNQVELIVKRVKESLKPKMENNE